MNRSATISKGNTLRLAAILLLIAAVFLISVKPAGASPAQPATPETPDVVIILRVDGDSGGGDGSSWGSAYASLQDALAAANPGLGTVVQIWVAEGVYYPDVGGGQTDNDRSATFQLKNSVAIYGGFAGSEDALNQRDWRANVTVLSGDINGNDTLKSAAGIAGSNSRQPCASSI